MLEYVQMYQQAIDPQSPGHTGFNRFAHDRRLAKPGYAPFKTPNADTLYSNAWLDLTDGPVILTVPDAGKTYFTVNLIDIYGNSSNISARTRGFGPGRYAIVPVGYDGPIPEGTERFTVTTPYCWILMRVLARDLANPVRAQALQSGFTLSPTKSQAAETDAFPEPDTKSAAGFMHILDWVVRNNGYPEAEGAYVQRLRMIGVGKGPEAIDEAMRDPEIRAGVQRGYAQAQSAINDSSRLSGYPAGTWKVPADIGAYGYNYFYRAAINTLGTGANVTTENYPFNTFADSEGDALDGSKHKYRLTFTTPPPAKFFWSLTLYDARTRELYPNAINRYIVNDRTPGLVHGKDGTLSIAIQHTRPADPKANWLPAPDGPFYLVIRAQGPDADLLEGRWLPPGVEKVGQ
ncbi:DUF1254 domain-containing protein [Novosphingobium malaysiense]|uniref:DUF1254 domain-containing protein n=1 Tax=Novosphingobium malaysiense TaxID=1348853 RepID=UPI0018CF9042|nr:DUF1254 domain-containing protein [Novosphingobium malaysiense]